MFSILKIEKKKKMFISFSFENKKMKTITKYNLSITNNLIGSFGQFSVLGDQVYYEGGPLSPNNRAGSRPRPKAPPKNKFFLKKKAPLFIVKRPKFL